MNKRSLNTIWDQTRQKYGVYLRLLEAIPEDKINEQIIPGMRTPADLVMHTSGGIVQGFAEGVARGEITGDQPRASIHSRADLLTYAENCWKAADAAIAEVDDDKLKGMVETPWNMSFPGGTAIHTMNDEFVHHRGQLYAYVRACGVEPPFVWSYGENPPGFGPKA